MSAPAPLRTEVETRAPFRALLRRRAAVLTAFAVGALVAGLLVRRPWREAPAAETPTAAVPAAAAVEAPPTYEYRNQAGGGAANTGNANEI
jgi:hypothetical protein